MAAAPLPRDSVLKVQANVYDFPIDAFDGEFGARKPGACGYNNEVKPYGQNSFTVVKGMVKDTLAFSKAEGKKVPRKGAFDCNSARLEEWFLPKNATSATCQELAFRPLDTLGQSFWYKRERRFFPIDSLAPAGQLEGGTVPWDPRIDQLTGTDSVAHNFNWCMEVNAQFTYRKGQVFHLDGEDDVWLYIDNHLVVDLGGIHGSNNTRIVDPETIPSVAGRYGEVFDFDLYQCERRPGGSEIKVLIGGSLDLRPPKFADLEMVFPDRTYPHPRRPLTGPTRFCAQPLYGSKAPCGNVQPPPDTPFIASTWSIGDKVLARDSACIWFDPRSIPPNTRMELTARAEGKTARLPLQVARANTPTDIVLAGNGRVDSIILKFDERTDSLYETLQMAFTLRGEERTFQSDSGLFRAERRSLVWLQPPGGRGPTGTTSQDSASGRVFQTVLGTPVFNPARLVDSATPAVWRAAWNPDDQGGFELVVTSTEPLAFPFPKPLDAFLFKDKAGRLITVPTAGVAQLMLPDGTLKVTFPASAGVDPRRLDSLSFSGAVRDPAGNYARLLFAPIDPLAWGAGRAEIVSAVIETNPVRGNPFEAHVPGRSLVLLDAAGAPVTPDATNAMLAASGGPVLSILSPDPVEAVDLKIYSNLGAFLHAERYEVGREEWDRLRASAAGDTVNLRLLWYPVSGGSKLGTGVYVVKGSIVTRRTWARAPGGPWLEKAPTRRYLGPLRFGYIRN